VQPIAIFRHAPAEGPGHFSEFLEGGNLPWRLIAIDAGDPLPASPEAFSGLVFMGGPMSVNDDLPWIPPVLELIRQAVATDIPVLGHCLGGQLIAKALGGEVGPNPVKEIGWGEVAVLDSPRRATGSGTSPPSRHSTGMARPFPSPPAPRASSATPTAPTRPTPWASTWACNAMWK
jgi:hypothetical protein